MTNPKHAPGRPARTPYALLIVGLVAGGLGLLLLLNTASAANEVRRHGLAEQDASIAAQLQQLGNDVAASAAPGNLARAAADLGMVPAGHPAFLVVGPDGKITVLGSPARVTGAGGAAIPGKTSRTPHPTKSATKTPSPSKSASTSPSTKASGPKSPGTGRHSSRSASGSRTPSPSPTPSPTPTPTVTLPGGNR